MWTHFVPVLTLFHQCVYGKETVAPLCVAVAVDDLLAEVPVFMMAAHLFWGLNCLAMALSDMADKFNYIACAEVRMSEYLRLKALLP